MKSLLLFGALLFSAWSCFSVASDEALRNETRMLLGRTQVPAPLSRFLAGDDRALDARQKAALRAFIDTGCSAFLESLGGEVLASGSPRPTP
jgi:hypothetical protein